MKKLLLIFALGLAACTNELDFHPVNSSTELMMNALINVGDAQHAVYLGLSTPTKVDTLRGNFSVSCDVNGSVVEAVEQDASMWPEGIKSEKASSQGMKVFTFAASFKPGDKVTITARGGGYNASSSFTVPLKAILESVDTATVVEQKNKSDIPYNVVSLAYKIKVRDVEAGVEDYYSLGISNHYTVDCYDESGLYIGRYSGVYNAKMDCGDDLILAEENIAMNNLGLDLDMGTDNLYGTFFDSQFDGAEVILRPKVVKSNILDNFYSVPYEMNGMLIDSVVVKPTMQVCVSHIPIRYYYYLKALNGLIGNNSFMRDGSSLESIQLPDNVEGGIGFIGIANPAYIRMPLPQISRAINGNLWYFHPGE